MWQLLACQHTKMIRGHCRPSQNMCTFCGKKVETQEHLIHECESDQVREIKELMYKDIVALISEKMKNDELRNWLKEHIDDVVNGSATDVSLPTDGHSEEHEEGPICLGDIRKVAWKGITAEAQTQLIYALLKDPTHRGRKCWKTWKLAKRLSPKVTARVSSAVVAIWAERAKLLAANTPGRKTRNKQTLREQAEELIRNNKLRNIANDGTMTIHEFDELSKKQQRSRIQLALKKLNGIKDGLRVNTLPRVGQHVRSYTLMAAGTKKVCHKQEGIVTAVTTNTAAPYVITSVTNSDMKVHTTLAELTHRLADKGECTTEEHYLQDKHFKKVFAQDQDSQDDTCHETFQHCQGGIDEIYCETTAGTNETETFAHVIYEDQDGEDIPFQQLLEEAVFLEDPCKASKLKQALAAKTGRQPQRAGRGRRTRRRAYTNASTQPSGSQQPQAGKQGTTTARAGALHYWNWMREGLFPRQADNQLRDQQQQSESGNGVGDRGAGGRGSRNRAGPGLPSGTVRDDG